ncbi:hypothetical protein Mgra_00008150 [Meloidogyne graminicola]|uniref:Uncharacterized protein n=1 Tax=Meloidogyne graminicola TaxID=189291 RepID=A0A8S9ZGK2_9BILA|nr:hypothetical protein Mgra_00008150 [Meloidogyne graminicola]
MESSLNKTINFSKQIILSFNLPNKQQYETLIPFFKAGFKAGCHHFNIKYNCIINNKKQNLKEFIQFINELINNSIKEKKKILHRWLIQHEMFIIKNFGTFNYLNISRQIGISDLKINEKI